MSHGRAQGKARIHPQKNETPLPGTANGNDEAQPDKAPTETTPAETPVMDPDSKPEVSAPAQKKA